MAELLAWLMLVVVGPLVFLGPGYILLCLVPSAHIRDRTASHTAYETLALSAVLSLCLLVLVAFLLTQTVGLTRPWLIASYLVLLGGLGILWLLSPEDTRAQPGTGAWSDRGGLSALEGNRTSLLLVGGAVLIVAAGGLIADGGEAYTEAYYASASDVPTRLEVQPGETILVWVVVENHEQKAMRYTISSQLIPNGSAGNSSANETIQLPAKATIDLEESQTHEQEIRLQAPEQGTWKLETQILPEKAGAGALTLHRWIEVGPS